MMKNYYPHGINQSLTKIEETPDLDQILDKLLKPNKAIILYNDDHNDMNHVISCLIKYCEHSVEQAHQCTFIVHNNGKYAVKHGPYEKLKPICEALLENQLTAKIEE